ncbi:MAG: nucleotidyltransferase domain-containing protein [Nitrospirae bacterium]|nr:nucleotidyltransferase domain-containing protein [Nitrospirota bacterium]
MLKRKGARDFTRDPVVRRFLTLIAPLPLMKNIKEIYLFGSRCRDDWSPDSDYDILLVVSRKERKFIGRLYDAVMDVLLETGRLISLKVFTVSEFQRLKAIPTPFIQNVIREGVRLEARS